MVTSIWVLSLYTLVIFSTLVLGLVGYEKKSQHKAAQTFFIFCLCAIGWMVSLYLGFFLGTDSLVEISTLSFRISFAFAIIAIGVLPIFFYLFPRKTFSFSPIIESLYVLFLIAFAFFSAFTDFIYESAVIITPQEHIADVLGAYYLLYTVLFLFFFIVAATLGVHKARNMDGIEKQKAILASWGVGLFFFFSIIPNLILPLFDIVVFQLQAPLFALFYIVPAVYAIIRYRFIDFRLKFQGSLSFVSNLAFYIGPIVLAMHLLSRDEQIAIVAIMIAITVLCGREVTNGFQTFWNYIFFRREMNPLQELEQSLDSFRISLARGLENVVQTLGVENGRFVLASNNEVNQLAHFFSHNTKGDLVRDELDYGIATGEIKTANLKSVQREMEKYMVALALPIFDDSKKLLGVFLLENKVDGTRFSAQEVQTLKKVLNDAVVYIARESQYKEMLKSNQPAEFMTALMHEIQQPLLVARTRQDLIDWKTSKPADKVHLEQTEKALGDLTHKLDRISEAFRWQIGDFPLERSYLDIQTFLDRVIGIFPNKNIVLDIKNEELKKKLFFMNTHYLQEAFVEILKNSFFFNKSVSPKVIITAEDKKNQLIFSISDNGIGIPKNHWQDVFELLFVISKSRNETECGLGVGLTKARGVILKHDGQCFIKKSSKKGTTVEIELPLEQL